MGGRKSGTPPSRELVEQALKSVADGTMSQRAAAKYYGIDRTTLSRYAKHRFFRRKVRRCESCGHVVHMPCVACSHEVQEQAAKRQALKRRRVVSRTK